MKRALKKPRDKFDNLKWLAEQEAWEQEQQQIQHQLHQVVDLNLTLETVVEDAAFGINKPSVQDDQQSDSEE
jgi:hypothetical protein